MEVTGFEYVSKCLVEGDITAFENLSRNLLYEDEVIAYDVVREYVDKHSSLPSCKVHEGLADDIAPKEDFEFLLGELKKRHISLSLTDKLSGILERGGNSSSILSQVASVVDEIYTDVSSGNDSSIVPAVPKGDKLVEVMKQHSLTIRKKGVTHLSSGYEFFDQRFGGWTAGSISSILGRPGTKKTWLALAFVHRVEIEEAAAGRNRPILFINNELSNEEVMERYHCLVTKTDYTQLTAGTLPMSKLRSMRNQLEKFESSLYLIDDARDTGAILRHIHQHKPCLVVIDGVYMTLPADKRKHNAAVWEKVGYVYHEIKAAAKKYNFACIATSQMNRFKSGGKKDRVSAMDSTGFSDAINQYSDRVFNIDYSPELDVIGHITIASSKLRRGRPFDIELNASLVTLSFDIVGEREDESTPPMVQTPTVKIKF
jgi:replicative DNA helicase